MQDAWRAYLELALGITDASRKKAEKVARNLAGKGGATAAQLQALAEDLFAASAANRHGLIRLVRAEVVRALGVVGLAKADEVAELAGRVRDLEREVAAARAGRSAAGGAPVQGGVRTGGTVGAGSPMLAQDLRTGDIPVARKVAKQAVATKSTAAAAAETATPRTTASEKAALKRTASKKAAPGTATPRKSAPRKAAPTRAGSGKAAPGKATPRKATP